MRVYFRTEESKLDDGRPLYTLGVHREDGEVIAAKHKDRLLQLKGQAKERRDILAGKRGVQMPLTAGVLAEAGQVARRKDGAP